MWATANFLMAAGWVMKEVGFRYVTCAVWKKDRIGLGRYMRRRTEFLLLGVRGPSMVPGTKSRPEDLIEAPKTKHSRKPPLAYERIRMISPGPRLELFARGEREGFDVWGHLDGPKVPARLQLALAA
jgi:N6-adenosine-specific RNA methylase IME4